MKKSKIIKTIVVGLLGATTIAGIVMVSIYSSRAFADYGEISSLNAQMKVYEEDPNHPYTDPSKPEYAAYTALHDKNVEANKKFSVDTTVLPYVATATFVCAGVLIYLGVNKLAHSGIRNREN